MAINRSIKLAIRTDLTGLRTGMNQARGLVDQSTGAMKASFMSLRNVASAALAGITVGGAITRLKSAFDFADEAAKSARAIGLTVEELTKLRYVAGQSGLSNEQLQTGLARLTKNMADAANGTGAARDAFRRLKVEFQETDGRLRSSSTVLKEVADRFAALPDSTEKTALALELFGRSGQQFISLLNQGSQGIAQMEERAERLGKVLGTKAAEAAEKFNDSLEDLNVAGEALSVALVNRLGPGLSIIAEKLANATVEGRLFETIIGGITDGALRFFRMDEVSQVRGELEALRKLQDEWVDRRDRLAKDQIFRFQSPTAYRNQMERYGAEIDKANVKMAELQSRLAELTKPAPPRPSRDPPASYDLPTRETERGLARQKQQVDEIARAREQYMDRELDRYAKEQAEVEKLYDDKQKLLAQYREQVRLGQYQGRELIVQTEIGRAHARGILDQDNAIRQYVNSIEEARKKSFDLAAFSNNVGRAFESAFERAIAGGEKLSDVIKALGQDLAALVTRRYITGGIMDGIAGLIFNAFSFGGRNPSFSPTPLAGGGGSFSSMARLAGFASGGSFSVGGYGGIDSQLVAFKATPGERVTVSHADSGGSPVNVNFTVNALDPQTAAGVIVANRDVITGIIRRAIQRTGTQAAMA